jgi:L-lactate dehydrogenase complex protein LldG
MSDDRAHILAAVAASLARRPTRTPRPDYDPAVATARGRLTGGDLLADLRRNFEAAAGSWLTSPAALAGCLREHGAHAGYCDPALPAEIRAALTAAGLACAGHVVRADIEALDFAVTRATAAIAETGSLVLTDADTPDRLTAIAPWIHVAVLDPATIRASLADMLASLPDDPNIVFVTGPSQTADVEGILIRGVHGPGVQCCLPMDSHRSQETAT